jgi:hypothetical protein
VRIERDHLAVDARPLERERLHEAGHRPLAGEKGCLGPRGVGAAHGRRGQQPAGGAAAGILEVTTGFAGQVEEALHVAPQGRAPGLEVHAFEGNVFGQRQQVQHATDRPVLPPDVVEEQRHTGGVGEVGAVDTRVGGHVREAAVVVAEEHGPRAPASQLLAGGLRDAAAVVGDEHHAIGGHGERLARRRRHIHGDQDGAWDHDELVFAGRVGGRGSAGVGCGRGVAVSVAVSVAVAMTVSVAIALAVVMTVAVAMARRRSVAGGGLGSFGPGRAVCMAGAGRARQRAFEPLHDPAQRLDPGELLHRLLGDGAIRRDAGALDVAEDLDALDGVDPEVGFDVHVEVEHVRRVPGSLAHDVEQLLGELCAVGPGGHHELTVDDRGCGLRQRSHRFRGRRHGKRAQRHGRRRGSRGQDRGSHGRGRHVGAHGRALQIGERDRALGVEEPRHQSLELDHHLRRRLRAGTVRHEHRGRRSGERGGRPVRLGQ